MGVFVRQTTRVVASSSSSSWWCLTTPRAMMTTIDPRWLSSSSRKNDGHGGDDARRRPRGRRRPPVVRSAWERFRRVNRYEDMRYWKISGTNDGDGDVTDDNDNDGDDAEEEHYLVLAYGVLKLEARFVVVQRRRRGDDDDRRRPREIIRTPLEAPRFEFDELYEIISWVERRPPKGKRSPSPSLSDCRLELNRYPEKGVSTARLVSTTTTTGEEKDKKEEQEHHTLYSIDSIPYTARSDPEKRDGPIPTQTIAARDFAESMRVHQEDVDHMASFMTHVVEHQVAQMCVSWILEGQSVKYRTDDPVRQHMELEWAETMGPISQARDLMERFGIRKREIMEFMSSGHGMFVRQNPRRPWHRRRRRRDDSGRPRKPREDDDHT